QACPVKVWALRHAGADEQSTVRSSLDGELVPGREFLGDQPLGRGDEVVEDVLLVGTGPGLVPLLAVLAAAAEVGDRVDSTHLHPGQIHRFEARLDGDVE